MTLKGRAEQDRFFAREAARKPQDIAGGQEKAKLSKRLVGCNNAENTLNVHSIDETCEVCGIACLAVAPASVHDQERPTVVDDDCCNHRVCCAHNVEHPPAPHIAKAEEPFAIRALREIEALEPRHYDKFPADWEAQIAACDECQGWAKNHPIQQGICDTHRRPLWDRERHDADEVRALGYRMRQIARAALAESADRGEGKA